MYFQQFHSTETSSSSMQTIYHVPSLPYESLITWWAAIDCTDTVNGSRWEGLLYHSQYYSNSSPGTTRTLCRARVYGADWAPMKHAQLVCNRILAWRTIKARQPLTARSTLSKFRLHHFVRPGLERYNHTKAKLSYTSSFHLIMIQRYRSSLTSTSLDYSIPHWDIGHWDSLLQRWSLPVS